MPDETPAMRHLRRILSERALELALTLTDERIAELQAEIAAEDKVLDRLFGRAIPLDRPGKAAG